MNKIEIKQSFIENHTVRVIILLILCQLFVVTIFGVEKESYHLDELFTYGLANSYYKPFLEFEEDSMVWHSPDYYKNYLAIQDDERFAYDSVYYNQVNDVHPPFYYYGIHTLCSFFPNVFSKWFGIVFNMIFLSGTVVVLFFLSGLIFNDKSISIAICIAYGFSAGAISNTVFIRMYMMLTFFTILTTYLHGLQIVNNCNKTRIVLAIIMVNIFGFLTQYIFVIYAYFLAGGYEVYLFKKRKWKTMFLYAFAMIGCIGICIIIFPECISHILSGQRGIEAISNFSMFGDLLIRLIAFILLLSYSLLFVPMLSLFILVTKIITKKKSKLINQSYEWKLSKIITNYFNNNLSDEKLAMFKIIFYSTIATFLVVVKISPYFQERYIAYLLPNVTIAIILSSYMVILNFIKDKRKVFVILTVVICVCTLVSYINGFVKYLYKCKADNLDIQMSNYFDCDSYCVATTTGNMTIAIPLLSQQKKSCYVSNEDDILKMMSKGGRNEKIVICFPHWDEEDIKEIQTLNIIIEKSEYSSYKQLSDKENSGISTNIYVIE